jgi:hypothetical protein
VGDESRKVRVVHCTRERTFQGHLSLYVKGKALSNHIVNFSYSVSTHNTVACNASVLA